MRRKLIIASAVVVIGLMITWRVVVARRRMNAGLEVLKPGMSEQEVLSILGNPKHTDKPCWSPRPGCEKDLVYTLPFEFVGAWTISLDPSGHVIGKQRWESP